MRGSSIAFVAVLGLAASPGLAQEVDVRERIARCAAVEGELSRLDCYDKLARDLGLIRSSAITLSTGDGAWITSVDTNPLDDSKTVTLVLLAKKGKSQWGDPVGLVIRCSSNSTAVYINWGEYLGSEAWVTSRVGSADAILSEWSISTDSKATFYPKKDIPFIRALMQTDRFVAQVTPYGESPKTVEFDLTGLVEAIKPLQEACGWQ